MTIHGCTLLILGDSRRSMAHFARIMQRCSIGHSSPSLYLGRSRIAPKFPYTANSATLFSRLNVISRSLNFCPFEILRSNSDLLCLRASFIENISSSSVGSELSAILDFGKLYPRSRAAKLKVGPISSNNFQACSRITGFQNLSFNSICLLFRPLHSFCLVVSEHCFVRDTHSK